MVRWSCSSLEQRVSYTCGGGRIKLTVEHGEVELLQPGAEAGLETVSELYLWWRQNGSDSGAW